MPSFPRRLSSATVAPHLEGRAPGRPPGPEDALPAIPDTAVTRQGDLWSMGVGPVPEPNSDGPLGRRRAPGGSPERLTHLTVGAYIARLKIWREWTKQWNIAKKPIKVFRSADAQTLYGDMPGIVIGCIWTNTARQWPVGVIWKRHSALPMEHVSSG
jgi:hypothetical protein